MVHAEMCQINTFFQGAFMSQMSLAGTGTVRDVNISTQAPVTQIMANKSTIQETKREEEKNI